MSEPGASGIGNGDPGQAIAALRARGAEGFDPVRFAFIEALARRTAAQRGQARRLLDGRLAQALAEYGERFEAAENRAGEPASPAGHGPASPLAELVAYIGQHASDHHGNASPGSGTPAPGSPYGGPPAELKSLRHFRETWSKLSVDQQLAQALAQGPENAGPLNSHLLVLQALKFMRDEAPDYLSRFMSYADTLLWLEQADGSSRPAPKSAPRGDGDKRPKAGRAKSG